MELSSPNRTASQNVARNVRGLLAQRQTTWADFAKSMGWSKATAGRRLKGLTAWDIEELDRAAQTLGVHPATLTTEDAA